MPRTNKRSASKRRNMARRRHTRRFASSGSTQHLRVHRRCAVYPKTKNSTWLDSLSWFGSIALRIFKTIYGVTDSLDATTAITGAGTSILLGPGDFAAASIASAQVFTSPDREVVACRAIPFERCALRRIKIRIVPSVDLGSRGGMYAACVFPIDTVDANYMQSQIIDKFSPDFDAIIKNPNARMAQVTEPITLTISRRTRPVDIRVNSWSDDAGWTNAYPQYVLVVAYSDLATNTAGNESHYSPSSSLFEVHLTGDIALYEPSELHKQAEKPAALSESISTMKLSSTDSGNINIKFLDRTWTMPSDKVSLLDLPYEDARLILLHYERPDLIPKLKLRSLSSSPCPSLTDMSIRDE